MVTTMNYMSDCVQRMGRGREGQGVDIVADEEGGE